MRLGLVGCGRIGTMHARLLHDLPDVKEVVLADNAPGRAAAVAASLGLSATAGVDELFDRGLDGLVVASATASHEALVTRAVRSSVPVFCEKPVAPDVDGTRRILDATAHSVGLVQVGFQRRFDPGYLAARQARLSGGLGRIHTLRACTFDPRPPAEAFIATSGGLIRDCGVHDFDVVRWLSGREVVSVFATGANRGDPFFSAYGDVDNAVVVLTLDDDTLATVSLGRYNGQGYDVRLEVLGTEGSVAVGLGPQTPLRSTEPHSDVPTAARWQGFMDRFAAAYRAELEAFVDMVRLRTASPCTARDALEALLIAEAAEQSRSQGRPVAVEEVRR
jgi:myo-inositol 2-dehydrogenase / D-chiro-inositol 1-dehydrogenase